MKIGIITFHFAHNQGAVLQCFAMSKALQKSGHSAYVIDYCPPYHAIRYSAKRNPFLAAELAFKKNRKNGFAFGIKQAIKGFVKAIYVTVLKTYKLREQKFSAFVDKNINLTKKYKTLKSLIKNPPKMDVYLSGSDQLFNPDLLDGDFDGAYFLTFGDKTTKKITYAVSLKESYTEKQKSRMAELLKDIDYVSSREHSEVLDEILGENYTVCIDPTLLLNKEDYKEAEADFKEKEPYIFVYALESSPNLYRAIETISKETGMRVICGSPEKVRIENAKNVSSYAPDMFLSYIKNADFVVTNSFHGTAFSLIYEKQFVTVPHTTRARRMTELLGKIGLSNRLWYDDSCNWKAEIDYKDAKEKLDEIRNQSMKYLENSIK